MNWIGNFVGKMKNVTSRKTSYSGLDEEKRLFLNDYDQIFLESENTRKSYGTYSNMDRRVCFERSVERTIYNRN